jgi:hypothetical protein
VRPVDILSLGRRKLVAPERKIERCGDATRAPIQGDRVRSEVLRCLIAYPISSALVLIPEDIHELILVESHCSELEIQDEGNLHIGFAFVE